MRMCVCVLVLKCLNAALQASRLHECTLRLNSVKQVSMWACFYVLGYYYCIDAWIETLSPTGSKNGDVQKGQ